MRITGGTLKGRRISVPHGGLEIRPAMDRMRESVFAILGDLAGLSFLDLFAGSGILGLEAASRDADPVVCVEKDRDKFPYLLENVAISARRIECHSMPAERFVLRNQTPFDVVFLDPPFPYAYRRELLSRLSGSATVSDEGLVLIHHPREDRLPGQIDRFGLVDEREYGRSVVKFYRAGRSATP